jgi:hypothetical protein
MPEKEQELKHINVLSFGKVMAVIGAIIGLIVGILFAAQALVLGGMIGGLGLPGGGLIVGLGVASIVIFPIVYAIVSFIGGIIFAVIYNFVASKVGPIKITLE